MPTPDAANRRRIALIEKEHSEGLAPEGAAELAALKVWVAARMSRPSTEVLDDIGRRIRRERD